MNIQELFEAEENKTYPTYLNMSDFSDEDQNPLWAFLEDINAMKYVVSKRRPQAETCLLKHPNYKYKIHVEIVPIGAADSFGVTVSRR